MIRKVMYVGGWGEKMENTYEIKNLTVPKIDKIHQKVYEAARQPGALNMASWHCGTANCRGGWVVVLAGEDGRRLEEEVGTWFAMIMIYNESDPAFIVKTNDFFEEDKIALKSMRLAALREAEHE